MLSHFTSIKGRQFFIADPLPRLRIYVADLFFQHNNQIIKKYSGEPILATANFWYYALHMDANSGRTSQVVLGSHGN